MIINCANIGNNLTLLSLNITTATVVHKTKHFLFKIESFVTRLIAIQKCDDSLNKKVGHTPINAFYCRFETCLMCEKTLVLKCREIQVTN